MAARLRILPHAPLPLRPVLLPLLPSHNTLTALCDAITASLRQAAGVEHSSANEEDAFADIRLLVDGFEVVGNPNEVLRDGDTVDVYTNITILAAARRSTSSLRASGVAGKRKRSVSPRNARYPFSPEPATSSKRIKAEDEEPPQAEGSSRTRTRLRQRKEAELRRPETWARAPQLAPRVPQPDKEVFDYDEDALEEDVGALEEQDVVDEVAFIQAGQEQQDEAAMLAEAEAEALMADAHLIARRMQSALSTPAHAQPDVEEDDIVSRVRLPSAQSRAATHDDLPPPLPSADLPRLPGAPKGNAKLAMPMPPLGLNLGAGAGPSSGGGALAALQAFEASRRARLAQNSTSQSVASSSKRPKCKANAVGSSSTSSASSTSDSSSASSSDSSSSESNSSSSPSSSSESEPQHPSNVSSSKGATVSAAQSQEHFVPPGQGLARTKRSNATKRAKQKAAEKVQREKDLQAALVRVRARETNQDAASEFKLSEPTRSQKKTTALSVDSSDSDSDSDTSSSDDSDNKLSPSKESWTVSTSAGKASFPVSAPAPPKVVKSPLLPPGGGMLGLPMHPSSPVVARLEQVTDDQVEKAQTAGLEAVALRMLARSSKRPGQRFTNLASSTSSLGTTASAPATPAQGRSSTLALTDPSSAKSCPPPNSASAPTIPHAQSSTSGPSTSTVAHTPTSHAPTPRRAPPPPATQPAPAGVRVRALDCKKWYDQAWEAGWPEGWYVANGAAQKAKKSSKGVVGKAQEPKQRPQRTEKEEEEILDPEAAMREAMGLPRAFGGVEMDWDVEEAKEQESEEVDEPEETQADNDHMDLSSHESEPIDTNDDSEAKTGRHRGNSKGDDSGELERDCSEEKTPEPAPRLARSTAPTPAARGEHAIAHLDIEVAGDKIVLRSLRSSSGSVELIDRVQRSPSAVGLVEAVEHIARRTSSLESPRNSASQRAPASARSAEPVLTPLHGPLTHSATGAAEHVQRPQPSAQLTSHALAGRSSLPSKPPTESRLINGPPSPPPVLDYGTPSPEPRQRVKVAAPRTSVEHDVNNAITRSRSTLRDAPFPPALVDSSTEQLTNSGTVLAKRHGHGAKEVQEEQRKESLDKEEAVRQRAEEVEAARRRALATLGMRRKQRKSQMDLPASGAASKAATTSAPEQARTALEDVALPDSMRPWCIERDGGAE